MRPCLRTAFVSTFLVLAPAVFAADEGMSTESKLTLLFTGVVAAATVVYAWLTWSLVSETRRMRRVQTDARVAVTVMPSPYAFGFADLLVRNFGAGAATDVKFEIVETKPGQGDAETLKALRGFGFMKNGFGYMAPGYEHRTFLVGIVGRSEQTVQTNIHVRVTYRSPSGEAHDECYPIDLTQFWNRFRLGDPPMDRIAKELELLRKQVERIRQQMLTPPPEDFEA